ncbi:MAG: glycoside hydrolase family 43 protein [Candidatus Marinimicrobia bacterium]|nr:glycoside hydrolase family 43 protein [Candidatus Neomarinimicrobiota bacterium]MCF7880617.1 glycoside hydrolase family 43 protein [Candidatus Neomarinimicrobiota bacterium]
MENTVFGAGQKMFTNPILSGFYPDPSVCRVDSNYYLVNSTFSYYPGIPVFHSRDLVHWELLGYAMDRAGQLNLDSLGVSRGIFAPAINHYRGTFYITSTVVDGGGNFVITAQDPAGPWSKPVWLPEVNGIDPSLFFDTDGKAYLVYNSIPPNNSPKYQGHRTIRIREFNTDNLGTRDEEYILVNGGTDISNEPIWIEGPHLFHLTETGKDPTGNDGYYYLIAAEGGTGYEHSEVVFRSKNVFGPYTPFEDNPILTQRDLPPDREHPITSTGHADMVRTVDGDWWATFLGCRPYEPYEKDYYNTGRETFLTPVEWIEGWPIINPDHEEVQYQYPYPVSAAEETPQSPYGGDISYTDDFETEKLDLNWMFLRTVHEEWYALNSEDGTLRIQVRPETCAGKGNPSFLGRRQQNLYCSASTRLSFSPRYDGEKAGLLIFQNGDHFYYLCKSSENGRQVVQLFRSVAEDTATGEMKLLNSRFLDDDTGDLWLKITAEGNTYSFHFATEAAQWILLRGELDASFLSTKVAGGFVGAFFALYTTSLGQPSENSAVYDWFKYEGTHPVFSKKNVKKSE